MIDSDVDLVMKQPWIVTGSDGTDGHPRQYATFPRKYAVYVQERHVIDLKTFIRQSTGLSADIFKLDRRGYLRPVISLTSWCSTLRATQPRQTMCVRAN
jgi:N-acyl-D-aspartate/D-glutamate deacylase